MIPSWFSLKGVTTTVWPLDGSLPLEIMQIEFDSTLFDAAWFADAGIAFPLNIQRSVRKRQAEFFFGRLCANAALERLGFVGVPVGIGELREPVWPETLVGSITHTSTMAGATAMRAQPRRGVGIDIENVVSPESGASMPGFVVNEQEMSYLRFLSRDMDLAVLLTLVFSAKESFFKGVNAAVMHYFDFDAIELVSIDLVRQVLTFVVRYTLCPHVMSGSVWSVSFRLCGTSRVITAFVW